VGGVAGPGLAQFLQQSRDGLRVVEAGVGGRVAGQQGIDGVAGPGLAQRPKQPGDGPRVVEVGVGWLVSRHSVTLDAKARSASASRPRSHSATARNPCAVALSIRSPGLISASICAANAAVSVRC
jgi:hypothetical protein